ncbi:Protein of unknown function, partial [Gryllus bimaculatus]
MDFVEKVTKANTCTHKEQQNLFGIQITNHSTVGWRGLIKRCIKLLLLYPMRRPITMFHSEHKNKQKSTNRIKIVCPLRTVRRRERSRRAAPSGARCSRFRVWGGEAIDKAPAAGRRGGWAEQSAGSGSPWATASCPAHCACAAPPPPATRSFAPPRPLPPAHSRGAR